MPRRDLPLAALCLLLACALPAHAQPQGAAAPGSSERSVPATEETSAEATWGPAGGGDAEAEGGEVGSRAAVLVVVNDARNLSEDQVIYTDPITASENDTLEFRVQIVNSGDSTAVSVVLTNTLPVNTTFVSISGPGSPGGGSPWSLPDIPPASTATYYITATVDPGGCQGVTTNTASVAWALLLAGGRESRPRDSSDTADLYTRPVVMSSGITQSITSFTTTGGHVTITLSFTGAPLHNVVLTDNLSARFQVWSGMTYSSALAGPAAEPSIGDDGDLPATWQWSGPIPAGTHTIEFDIADANGNCSLDANLVPTLTLWYEDSCGNALGPVTGSAQLFNPKKALIAVTKEDVTQITTSGANVTWTITATNTGDGIAGDLDVVDTLGDGFTYVPGGTSPTPDSVVGNTLTWSGKTLSPAQDYIITLEATVLGPGDHSNTVLARENGHEGCVVDEDSASAIVVGFTYDKSLDQSTGVPVDPTADAPGEIVTFTLTPDFQIESPYENAVVADTLPEGLEYVTGSQSVAPGPWSPASFAIGGKRLSWLFTDFTGLGTATITYEARIIREGAVARGSVLENSSSAGFEIPPYVFPGSLPGFSDSESFVFKEPLLSFTRLANPPSGSVVRAGEAIDHTLIVTNDGSAVSAPAHTVTVVDTLPVGCRGQNPTSTVFVARDGTPLTGGVDYTTAYSPLSGVLMVTLGNTSLGVLPAGSSYAIQYTTRPDADVGAGVTMTHSADVTAYYSQLQGTQGAVMYDNVTARQIEYTTLPSTHAKVISAPASKKAAPGGVITYRITFDIPAGTSVFDLSVEDVMPAGMAYLADSSTGPGTGTGGPNIGEPEPTVNGQVLTWYEAVDDVDVTNGTGSTLTYTITYQAVVLNEALVTRGLTLTNACVYDYNRIDDDPASRTDNGTVGDTATVIEPELVLTKTIVSTGPYAAGDVVRYRINITHAGVSDAPAYDVEFIDVLEAGLTYDSYVPNPNNPGAPSVVGQTMTWGGAGGIDVALGSSFTFDVLVVIDDPGVGPGRVLTNTGVIRWTSVNGDDLNERDGSGVPAYNDYSDSAAINVTTNDPTSLGKSIEGSPSYVIGGEVGYRAVLTVSEGTTAGVALSDQLPQGVEFVSGSIVDGNGGMSYTLADEPDPGDTGAIAWDFGAVVNPDNGNDADDTITVSYTVRILNSVANQAGTSRSNAAVLSYVDGEGVPRSTAQKIAAFIVKEPDLDLEKTYGPQSYMPGDTVAYTIRVWHHSTASPNDVPAFDVVVTDAIPDSVTYVPGSISVVSGPAGTADDAGAPNLSWTFETVGTTYDAGNPIVLAYEAVLSEDVVEDQELVNDAGLTWTSLAGTSPHERTGADGPGGALNDYAEEASATVTVYNPINLVKSTPGGATGAIGEPMTFQLRLNIAEITVQDVVIRDVLPSTMVFVGSAVTPGNAGITYTLTQEPSPGSTGELVWDLGDVTNPPNGNPGDDTITVAYTAYLANVAGNVDGTILTNLAHVEYTDDFGEPHTTPDQRVFVTVVEPDVAVEKTVLTAGPYNVGDQVTYRIDLSHTGQSASTAYDIEIVDTLDPKLAYVSYAPGPDDPGTPLVNGQLLSWGSTGSVDLLQSSSYSFTVTAEVTAAAAPGEILTNAAAIEWTSLDGVDPNERDGSGSPSYNDYQAADETEIEIEDLTGLAKSVVGPLAYAVGETVTYAVTMTLPEGTIPDVVLEDALPEGLRFSAAAIMNGNAGITYALAAAPAPGDTGLIAWDFGSIGNPANGNDTDDTITVEYSVIVTDTPSNAAGAELVNAAQMSYVDGQGNPNQTAVESATVTVAEPDLRAGKTGAASIELAGAGTFTVTVANAGASTGWQATLVDVLPDEMRATAPSVTSIEVGTPARVLHESAPDDYDAGYDGASGALTITLKSYDARIEAGEVLTVVYDASLGEIVPNGTGLTNGVTVTSYYSVDTSAGVPDEARNYAFAAGSGTPQEGDDQGAAHEVVVAAPVLTAVKDVDQTAATPGDVVHYTVVLSNAGDMAATNVSFEDAMDAAFAAGTLANVTAESGSVDADPTGGPNGTGLVAVTGIDVPADGGSVEIAWDVTLQPVLPGGTEIPNRGTAVVPATGDSVVTDSGSAADDNGIEEGNDPADPNDDDPTVITAASLPLISVSKTADDDNGAPLEPGDVVTYEIVIANTGSENAVDASLVDAVPGNAAYVAGSTTLNGTAVDDVGESPLVAGLEVHTPGDPPGRLTAGGEATVTYQVTVLPDVLPGTVIANQATLFALGESSGPLAPVPSDDPGTAEGGDATRVVVGSASAIDASKTVLDENGGLVESGDALAYTLTVRNFGTAAADDVVVTDAIPDGATYAAGSMRLDPDGAGPATEVALTDAADGDSGDYDVTQSNAVTIAVGDLEAGVEAVVTFRVEVDAGTAPGTVVSNQGVVRSRGLPDEPTDADGDDENGDQPTEVVTGASVALRASKTATDLNGGRLLPGDVLGFEILVTNVGSVQATSVVLADAVPPEHTTYVAGSTAVDGAPLDDDPGAVSPLAAGLSLGTIPHGASRAVSFRVTVDASASEGVRIANQGTFAADGGIDGVTDSGLNDGIEAGNDPDDPNDDDPTIAEVGASPGSGGAAGVVWRDTDHNKTYDEGEPLLAGWVVEILQDGSVIGTATTDADGAYAFLGLPPGPGYEIRFRHPGSRAVWGVPVSNEGNTEGGTIADLALTPGTVMAGQSLPVDPSGTVYQAVSRRAVAGATLRLRGPSGFDPEIHLLPGQNDQVTSADGQYRFDVVAFGLPGGPPEGLYVISVDPPAGMSETFPSVIIPPEGGILDPTGEPDPFPLVPNNGAPEGDDPTTYYIGIYFEPGNPAVVNNHVPLDPAISGELAITKTASKRTASVGDLIAYTVHIQNGDPVDVSPVTLSDQVPVGLKYVAGSAQVNGEAIEPSGDRVLSWTDLTVEAEGSLKVGYVLVVGSGVREGAVAVNAATLLSGETREALSATATAEVEIVAAPVFSRTMIIGKVFHDRNGDGAQQAGEEGLPGVRVASVSGVLVTTDSAGRYHIDDMSAGESVRGRNAILKVDPATLPAGSVFTTENPRVTRLTQGLAEKVNFGVRIPGPGEAVAMEAEPEPPPCPDRDGDGVCDVDDKCPRTPAGVAVDARGCPIEREAVETPEAAPEIPVEKPEIADDDGDGVPNEDDRCTRTPAGAPVNRWGCWEIPPVTFGEGQSEVDPSMYEELDVILEVMRSNPGLRLQLHGFTDTGGTDAANQEISEERARAVMQYFIGWGIDSARLSAEGHGASMPVAPNDTYEGRALNRRVQFRVIRTGGGDSSSGLAPGASGESGGTLLGARSEPTSPDRQERPRVPLASWLNALLEALTPEAHAASAEGSAGASALEAGLVAPGQAEGSGEDLAVWATTDVLRGDARVLSVIVDEEPVSIAGGRAVFHAMTNYPDYIEEWRLEIMDAATMAPIARLTGSAGDLGRPIVWDLRSDDGYPVEPGVEYAYALTVLDESGNADRTAPRRLRIESGPAAQGGGGPEWPRGRPAGFAHDRDDLATRSIVIRGGVVTVFGEGAPPGSRVTVDGYPVEVDREGRFAAEFVKPFGAHEIEVRVATAGRASGTVVPVNVRDTEFFMVGIADVTVGGMDLSGHVEPVSGSDEFEEEVYVHGRLAFYLKGKIRGEYLLTAQMDTDEEPIKEILNRLDDRNPRSIFRRLDPEAYYPVYGDDSVTTVDTDTQGKFYVRLERGDSSLLWGNYHTQMNDTDLTSFNRSLYGARLSWKDDARTRFEDRRSDATAFWAEPQTRHSRDEIRSTGGSLYYLKHADVVVGSEQVFAEVRDAASGLVTSSTPLIVGADYEMDWLQGRLVLRRPLAASVDSGDVIGSDPLGGEAVYLVVDYEYDAARDADGRGSYGGRGSYWLHDLFRVGATYVTEERVAGDDYESYGFDADLKLLPGTVLSGEWGESHLTQSGASLSDDGGLTFADLPALDLEEPSTAWKVAFETDLGELCRTPGDLSDEFETWCAAVPDVRIAAHYVTRERGYSTSGQNALHDSEQYGASIAGEIAGGYLFRSEYAFQREEGVSELTTARLQIGKTFGQRLKITAEGRYRGISAPEEDDLQDVIGAARVDFRLSERATAYAAQQMSIDREGETPENNATSLGVGLDLTSKLRVDAEAAAGSIGQAGALSTTYAVSDGHEAYGSVRFENTRLAGRMTRTTVGNRGRITEKLSAYTEHQLAYGTREESVSEVFGLDYAPTPSWSLSIDYGRSAIDKRDASPVHRYLTVGLSDHAAPGALFEPLGETTLGIIDRDVVTGTVAYRSSGLSYRTKAQVRLDAGESDRTQVVTTNYLDWDASPSVSLLLALDYSRTWSEDEDVDDALFIEGNVGLAYRPVASDWVNLIGKYTYLEDLAPVGQEDGAGFDERSHIGSFQGIFDLTPKWQIGGTFAYKRSSLRLERGEGDWVESETYLGVGRLTYHFVRAWDATGEYRALSVTPAEDTRSGYLAAIYRHFGDYVKVGVGYNFTDFSDDLTHLDYEASGWFVNVVGKW
jgi:uncharacterized repeat protein (TIGR01451 family)/fimbrial isopeptide formation D2 family protein